MQALRELLTTDIGLLSLVVLLVLFGIAGYMYFWFRARVREEVAARADAPRPHGAR
jgi:hypothetical protein